MELGGIKKQFKKTRRSLFVLVELARCEEVFVPSFVDVLKLLRRVKIEKHAWQREIDIDMSCRKHVVFFFLPFVYGINTGKR